MLEIIVFLYLVLGSYLKGIFLCFFVSIYKGILGMKVGKIEVKKKIKF